MIFFSGPSHHEVQVSWTCWSFCKEANTYALTFCSWRLEPCKNKSRLLTQLGPSLSHTRLNIYPESLGWEDALLFSKLRQETLQRLGCVCHAGSGAGIHGRPRLVARLCVYPEWCGTRCWSLLEMQSEIKMMRNVNCRLTFQPPTFSGPSQRSVEEDI